MKEQANAYVAQVMQWLQTAGLNFGVRLVAALVIFVVGVILIRILASFLHRTLGKIEGDNALLVKFITSVCVKLSWAFLLVLVLGKLGVEVAPLIAGLGATGLVIGFACQESLGSLAAGVMIALNHPFKVGDYVVIAGYEGRIDSLDMMAVVLHTADNRRVTVPNKTAWSSPIVNYSALALRRVDLAIGIAYGADIAKAKAVALEVLGAHPAVLRDPAPLAEVKSLDDSAVSLTIRAWVKNADYWTAYFDGLQLLKEAFDRAGIAIPFPQLDVHLDR